jgi:PEP-CTERM motif
MDGDVGIEAAGGDVAADQLFDRSGRHRRGGEAIPDTGSSAVPTTPTYSIYGVSSVLTVPMVSVPEPSTIVLLGLGAGLLLGYAYRPRRRPIHPSDSVVAS